MTVVNIYDYEDFTLYLSDWMKARGHGHRQVAMLTGQFDVAVVNNLIKGRRSFTPELRDAFTPLLQLDDVKRRYLDLLVSRADARARLKKKEAELSDLEQLDERRRSSVQHRNHLKNLKRSIKADRDAISSYDKEVRGAQAMARAQRLDQGKLPLLDRWSTVAIGELARCPGFQWSAEWLRRRVPGAGTPAQIASSLTTLERCEVIARDGEAGGRHRGQPLVAQGPTEPKRLRAWYSGLLRRAKAGVDALFEDRWAWERSEVGATTVALSPSTLPRARALVEKFRMDLLALSEGQDDSPDEVYQMFVVLFPVTAPVPSVSSPAAEEAHPTARGARPATTGRARGTGPASRPRGAPSEADPPAAGAPRR